MNKRLVIIGNNVPEPKSTAAGGRMMDLIEIFKDAGFDITFLCATAPGKRSVDLSSFQVDFELTTLNDDSFNDRIKEINPNIVMYDRFYMEEQYGWRVAESCPAAKTILDTEDLHFLRKARERAIISNIAFNNSFFNHPDAYREIASIKRCDLSLIISTYEMDLLQSTFKVDSQRLFYIPLLVKKGTTLHKPKFEDTSDFFHIGNFMHAPNEDAVWQLKKYIWPEIRKKLPKAKLHIYGSYAKEKHRNWHNEKENFLIHGAVDDVAEAFLNKRVLLTPLRYGAGLKGKIIDAMKYGIPVSTTMIGAEGIGDKDNFNGLIADTDQSFIDNSIELYMDKNSWLEKQERGYELLEKDFGFLASDCQGMTGRFAKALQHRVHKLLSEGTTKTTFEHQMLKYHGQQHLKFKGKWIGLKNKSKQF